MHYIKKVCVEHMVKEAECIQVLAHLVDLLQATWSMSVEPEAIQRASERALHLWVGAGWKVIKKHHWLLHLGQAFKTHKVMAACWTMERKHRFVSQIGSAVANTSKLEQSVMEEVAAKELHALTVESTFAVMEHQLKKPHKLPHKLAGTVGHLWPMVDVKLVTTSHTAWLQHGASCSQGDVVLLSNDGSGMRAGQIQLHVAFAGQTLCLVSLFSLLEVGKGNAYAVWHNNSSQVAAIPLCQVATSCVYAQNDQRVTTLIPLPWR